MSCYISIMKPFLIFAFGVLIITLLEAQVTTTHGTLKLVHAKASQTPVAVKIKIVEPLSEQIINGSDVQVKFSLENWILSNDNHLHFLLDDEPIHDHYSRDPFVFHNVSPGPHVIRVFPAYAWHESVKQQQALGLVRFFVKEKTGSLPIDLNKPMMIYSTPVGSHQADEKLHGQPYPGILIDWFLQNVTLGSRTGYTVRISVDGKALTNMKEWRPHYIQGLPPDEHRIKLELLKNGIPVKENWNVTERTITVSRARNTSPMQRPAVQRSTFSG
jgi:hypothetical protein